MFGMPKEVQDVAGRQRALPFAPGHARGLRQAGQAHLRERHAQRRSDPPGRRDPPRAALSSQAVPISMHLSCKRRCDESSSSRCWPQSPCWPPARQRPPIQLRRRRLLPEAASGYDGQAGLGHPQVRGGRGQPAGHRRRLPDAEGRRLGRRRRHRRADGADAGGAAVQRHRRRRLPAALTTARTWRRSTAARPRPRPPTRSCSSAPTASRWPSTTPWSAAARSACRARCACWRWRTGSTASCRGPQLFEPAIVLAEGGFKVSPRLNTAMPKADPHLKKDPVAARLLLQARRRCPRRRLRPAQPRAGAPCCAGSRPQGSRGPARGRDRTGHRRQGAKAPDQSRPDDAGRPRRLPAEETRADLPRPPGTGQGPTHLRLPAAEFGCDRRRPDPRHPERHQRRHPAPGERPARRELAAPVHSRRRAWHSPTATSTWATPISSQPPGGKLDEPARSRLPGAARPPDRPAKA